MQQVLRQKRLDRIKGKSPQVQTTNHGELEQNLSFEESKGMKINKTIDVGNGKSRN